MEIVECPIPGVVLVKPVIYEDARGSFVKSYHRGRFREALGVDPRFVEEFHTTSKKGVLRGMHFQVPPADHDKFVTCLAGAIWDVVLDLRAGSPSYGKSHGVELTGGNRLGIFIPAGVAHGFLTLHDQSLVLYRTTHAHAPECDTGVRWNSFGFDWGVENPITSEKDAKLPAMADFKSPFVFS